jgi:hypothetical protein
VRALSLERPGWGGYTLSDYLKFQGISVSGPTIQTILARQGLGSKYERLLRLEERALEEGIELTPSRSRWWRRRIVATASGIRSLKNLDFVVADEL